MLSRWTSRAVAITLGLWVTGTVAAVDFVVSDDGQPVRRKSGPTATDPTGIPRSTAVQNRTRYPDPSLRQGPDSAGPATRTASRGIPSQTVGTPTGGIEPYPAPSGVADTGCAAGDCQAGSCDGGALEAGDGGHWEEGPGDWAYDGAGPGGMPCQDFCGQPSMFSTACGSGMFFFDMWLAQGFTGNYDDPNNNFNLPVTFNDRANEYQMNQLYLSLGKKVADCGEMWDLGGRLDLLYGTDYFFTQAAGLETRRDGSRRWNGDGPRAGGTAALYGLAMPQVYAEVYAPVLSGINVKLGHFYTTLGYESVMAPANFFYSHAYSMQYGLPITHTGVLASVPLSDRVNGHFGYTRGWNNWEDLNAKPGYLAGLTWTMDCYSSLAFAMHTGHEDLTGQNNRVVYSMVMTRQLSDRMRWVLQHDLGSEALAEINQNLQPEAAKWYGINNYLFWDISRCVTWGTRVEWFRDQDNARVLAIPNETLVRGGTYVEVSTGLNVKLGRRWMWRPHVRWDYSDVVPPGGGGMFNDFTEDHQITTGFDLIFQL